MKHFILPILLILILLGIFFSSNFFPKSSIVLLNQEIKSDIFKRYKSKYLFVFFGYVGCTDVCIPRLQELAPIYKKLKYSYHVDIDTVFINLIPLRDKELPNLFATTFHKDFHGIYLNNDKIRGIQNEFHISLSKSLLSEGSWDHTSFLFLLQKERSSYYLKRVYLSAPFSQKQIVNDVLGI